METFSTVMKNIRRSIGMRTIKTAVAVALCFVIYQLRGRQGIPFYSALSAIWCIRPDISNSKNMAIQRTLGTLIGAGYGLLVLLIESNWFTDLDEVAGYLISSFALIPIIMTTVALKKKDTSYFACVVFLSIVINHLRDPNPYLFVWNRICDTMIGIVVALVINIARFPYYKNNNVLYVSGLDEVLLTNHNQIPDFSKRELNRMLDEGMHFTIATMRTPASMITPLKDLHITMPIIAMDGTVLFSMKDNSFLKTFPIKHEIVKQVTDYLDGEGVHYFINSILQDTLFIYYGVMQNDAEKELFLEMRTSPYRNYLYGYPTEKEDVVYLMILVRSELAQKINEDLKKQPFTGQIRWITYPSQDYPGYHYIKIYDVQSSRQNMIEYLKEQAGVDQSISFGSVLERCDVFTGGLSADEVVKKLRNHYEPLIWKKKTSSYLRGIF